MTFHAHGGGGFEREYGSTEEDEEEDEEEGSRDSLIFSKTAVTDFPCLITKLRISWKNGSSFTFVSEDFDDDDEEEDEEESPISASISRRRNFGRR